MGNRRRTSPTGISYSRSSNRGGPRVRNFIFQRTSVLWFQHDIGLLPLLPEMSSGDCPTAGKPYDAGRFTPPAAMWPPRRCTLSGIARARGRIRGEGVRLPWKSWRKKQGRRGAGQAIETAGDVSMLADRLRDLEGRAQAHPGSDHQPPAHEVGSDHWRHAGAVTQALLRFKDALVTGADGDSSQAKEAIARHVGKLALNSQHSGWRPAYKVTGNVTIPPPDSEKCRMQAVTRGGIEPPPPAFSGLLSLRRADLPAISATAWIASGRRPCSCHACGVEPGCGFSKTF